MAKADDIFIGGILLSEENYLALRKAYKKALKNEETEFEFQKNTLLTDFAKYVLECMETYPIIKPLKQNES